MLARILLFISSVNIQYSLVTQYLKRVHLRTVSLPPYYSGLHKQIVGLSLKRELEIVHVILDHESCSEGYFQ